MKLGIDGWRVSAATFIYNFGRLLCFGFQFGAVRETEMDRVGRQHEHLQRLLAWRCGERNQRISPSGLVGGLVGVLHS